MADREARLATLDTRTDEWADKLLESWQKKLDRSKAILKGRTGGERLGAAVTDATTEAAANELDDFFGS